MGVCFTWVPSCWLMVAREGHIGTMLSLSVRFPVFSPLFCFDSGAFPDGDSPVLDPTVIPQVILFILTYALAWVFGLPG